MLINKINHYQFKNNKINNKMKNKMFKIILLK